MLRVMLTAFFEAQKLKAVLRTAFSF